MVLDNENRMKSFFKDGYTRIGCRIHYVNKSLEHSFTSEIISKIPVKCKLVQSIFANIRKIISHTRHPHKQSKFSRKLQSYSDTGFNDAFYTMNVFLLAFDELVGVWESNVMNNYGLIDKDLLTGVWFCFLQELDQAIVHLSSDTKSTIYQVLPFRQYLLNHCKIHPDDHDSIQQIKIFLSVVLVLTISKFFMHVK